VEQIQNPKSKILKPSDLSVGSIQNPKSKIQNRMTEERQRAEEAEEALEQGRDLTPKFLLCPWISSAPLPSFFPLPQGSQAPKFILKWALLNKGMNEADAQTARRGDAVIIFDANSKIIPQLCNALKCI
jgi:hypothetical protein